MTTEQHSRAGKNRPNWRRRLLLGCGIALAAVLVLGPLVGWAISRHLGDLLASSVREQAAAALNGRLEFAKLEVDLAGRAVLTDAAVYHADSETPWIESPRTVIGFDLFNFFGPNRGRRAVTVSLNNARVVLVREPDGRFNLERLIKPREETGESIGLALKLRDLEIDFSDWCLLDQSYPQLAEGKGLAGQLLNELGYDRSGNAEAAIHAETLKLSGNIVLNPQRQELSLNTRLERQDNGGSLRATGAAKLDGTQYNIDLTLKDIDLTSIRSYIGALFPKLQLATVETAAQVSAVPLLAAKVSTAKLRLAKQPGQELALDGEADLANVQFASDSLPPLHLPQLRANYDSKTGRLDSNLELQALACQVAGRLKLNLNAKTLDGKLAVDCAEPARLADELELAELPLNGAVKAQLNLSGTLAEPSVTAQLSSDLLRYEELKLGKLAGSVKLVGGELAFDGIKLSGGEVDLGIGGSYNLAAGNGRLDIKAGPLPAQQALKLAALASPDNQMPELELAGAISAAVKLNITSARTTTALRVWSDRLNINGQQLDNLDVQASLSPPNMMIDEAEALFTSAEPLHLGGFSSDGPLKVKLRASGSLSTLPGQEQAALTIVGEGDTTNLIPDQAHLSFKALGPANDPELRLQIKTTHATQPLLLRAQGHYRKGFAPATASLSWQETTANFSGKIDIPGQRLDGQVTAEEVDLRRFSGNQQLSGQLSLTADAGGTFSEPSLKGSLSLPRLSLATDWRSYNVNGLSADFELVEGNSVSVANGSFTFEGNSFTAAGKLGQAGSNLSVNCANFNLFSVLAMVEPPSPPDGAKTAPTRPPLEIVSSGPLNIELTGDLGDPRAAIEYTSGAGQVEGHAFSSAQLTALVTPKQAKIEKFGIVSTSGQLEMIGQLSYQPLNYSAAAAVHGFDVGILTALSGNEQVSSLAGTLDGEFALRGGSDSYRADGQLKLRNGTYNRMAITEAGAKFSSSGDTTRITEGVIIADGRVDILTGEISYQPLSYEMEAKFQNFNIDAFTPLIEHELLAGVGGRLNGTLDLSGGRGDYSIKGDLQLTEGRFQGIAVSAAQAKIHAGGGNIDVTDASITAEGTRLTGSAHFGKQPADMRLNIQASSLDLALLSPFLPAEIPALFGKLAASVNLKPGGGSYPELELTADSTGGPVGAGAIRFDSLHASASIKKDKLILNPCELKSGQSSLYLTANLNLKMFDEQRSRGALPLDITIGSNNFDLDDVAGLLPAAQRQLVPGGVLTCRDVRVTGTTRDPQLSGTVVFDITRMPAVSPYLALISRATGEIDFTPGDITIDRLQLVPAGGSGAQGIINITGGGSVSLSPLQLDQGVITIDLGGQEYVYVNTFEADLTALGAGDGLPLNFAGWLGGTINLTAPNSTAKDRRPIISGHVSVNAEGQTSQIEMAKPKKADSASKPAELVIDKTQGLRIDLNAGTEFLFDRGSTPGNLDLRAKLQTAERDGKLMSITLRGVPGLLDKNNPEALSIDGEVWLLGGSMRFYRYVVRLDGSSNKLKFSGDPGDIYPYLTVNATLELPRVLTGNETFTSTGGGLESNGSGRGSRDLLIFIGYADYWLGPTKYTCADHPSVEEWEPGTCPKCGTDLIPEEMTAALQLNSEPPMAREQIMQYLLGGAVNVLTGSGSLAQFAEEELQAFGASFISRYIEEQLDLAAFRVGGSGDEDNPYFMDVEKELTPGFSVTYYRDFFSDTYQTEEYGVKYRILEQRSGDRYNNVELELNFIEGAFRGTGSEFMFTWNTRF